MNKLKEYLSSIPADLVDGLEKEYQKLHMQYFLERWEPSQLDAGRLVEYVFRILEYKGSLNITPIGKSLNRKTIMVQLENKPLLDESVRFHIPQIADLIYGFRNNRNVGHVGVIIVNEMDATFVLNAANWIMAELVRLETHKSPDDSYKLIQKLIERKVPLIEEIDNKLKILNPKLPIKDKILAVCYQLYPERVSTGDLMRHTEYDTSRRARFTKYLQNLSKQKALIDFDGSSAVLTMKGIKYVEDNIKFDTIV